MGLSDPSTPIANRTDSKTNSKGKRLADQHMIKMNENGKEEPVDAIEYKPPHKLGPVLYVKTGLQGEIRPTEDIIDESDGDFTYYTKRVVTAVVTQLFSYMTHTHVRYGYVSTGEVIILCGPNITCTQPPFDSFFNSRCVRYVIQQL